MNYSFVLSGLTQGIQTADKPNWLSPTHLLFFIIATNWKTIHHINIIAIFQKKSKTKIKQHLYTFLPRYWTTLIFTCSDEIGLEIILWQYDCTIRRESKHLQREEINKRKTKGLNKKKSMGWTLHHIVRISNLFWVLTSLTYGFAQFTSDSHKKKSWQCRLFFQHEKHKKTIKTAI